MRTRADNKIRKQGKQIAAKSAISLALLTALLGQLLIVPACQAQGLGPDQDSLLPPEVVPLDATGGASMQASQQQAMQAAQPAAQQMGSYNPNNMSSAPNQQMPAQEMQTPAEWRKAAYDSMMNNPNAQPVFAPQQAQTGQMPGQPGQPGMMAGQPGANGQPQLGQSGWQGGNGQAMATATQRQTLSGQAQQQNYNKKGGNSKLSGLAHTASMATMLGGGILMGALMFRRAPAYGVYSSGMAGASLLNYGLRAPSGMWW